MQELTRQEELQSIYWDMYKDAYGIRPRGIDTSGWDEADFSQAFEVLHHVITVNTSQRRADQETAAYKFEERVKSLMEIGAKDRAMALRWIHEAEDSNGDDEYLCYLIGLPYHYFAVDKAAV
jgi:hypothetical protein